MYDASKEFIKQQRLKYLGKGMWFPITRPSPSSTHTHIFFRLNEANDKFLYATCHEHVIPAVLNRSIQVSALKSFQKVTELSIQLTGQFEGHELIDILSFPNQETLLHWMEGLNALMGFELTTESARKATCELMQAQTDLAYWNLKGVPLPKSTKTMALPDFSKFDMPYSTVV